RPYWACKSRTSDTVPPRCFCRAAPSTSVWAASSRDPCSWVWRISPSMPRLWGPRAHQKRSRLRSPSISCARRRRAACGRMHAWSRRADSPPARFGLCRKPAETQSPRRSAPGRCLHVSRPERPAQRLLGGQLAGHTFHVEVHAGQGVVVERARLQDHLAGVVLQRSVERRELAGDDFLLLLFHQGLHVFRHTGTKG